MKLHTIVIILICFISSCVMYETNPIVDQYAGTCSDGILNLDEEEIDCGGVCPACVNPDMLTSSCTDQLSVQEFSGDLNVVFDSVTGYFIDNNSELYISAYSGTKVWEIGIRSADYTKDVTRKIYQINRKRNFWGNSAYLVSGFFESFSGDLYVDIYYGKINIEFCDITILEGGFAVNYVSGKLFLKANYN